MGKIDYQGIYDRNNDDWRALIREFHLYEELLDGHYSDSNHFVYELLQNAEDAGAGKVVIEYRWDRLVFFHDGKPFDEADVRGICSMLMGTKAKRDAQTIGHFGMGFKSVYKYTSCPEIYSDEEAFAIHRSLLPKEIEGGWDAKEVRKNLSYRASNGETYHPFAASEHLTRIEIPFQKLNEKGKMVKSNGYDVLEKLNSLSGDILLFLTHIRELYWIDCETERHVHITLSHEEGDEKRLIGRHTDSEKSDVETTHYLQYKRVWNHKEMRAAQVSIVYQLNKEGTKIAPMEDTPIWVYFPTREETKLPFLIHGSFQTAVSREKLMTISTFNDDLFAVLGNLIASSMTDLARRKLITQTFLRTVVIPSFSDGTIPKLKEKITKSFAEKKLLPDQSGVYRKTDELFLAVPFTLIEQSSAALWRSSSGQRIYFVASDDERTPYFEDYFSWLKDDLHIKIYNLLVWAAQLSALPLQTVKSSEKVWSQLREFYDFLLECYAGQKKYRFWMGGYEAQQWKHIEEAWSILCHAPIILNAANQLVPAVNEHGMTIYLRAASSHHTLQPEAIVHPKIAEEYRSLFESVFHISVFDDVQYVREKILPKYRSPENNEVLFQDKENFEQEHIEDIRALLALTKDAETRESLAMEIDTASIIKIATEDGTPRFVCPRMAYSDKSNEGIDLCVYFAPVHEMSEYESEEELSHDQSITRSGRAYQRIDIEFYQEYDISLSRLKSLGIVSTPVDEGTRESKKHKGRETWRALGTFCPSLFVVGLSDNLEYIRNYPQESLAKQKSAEILKLFLHISNKLTGFIEKRTTDPYRTPKQDADVLNVLRASPWLFDRSGELRRIEEISRQSLDPAIYEGLTTINEPYVVLGFAIRETIGNEEVIDQVKMLPREDKKKMMQGELMRDPQLMQELMRDPQLMREINCPVTMMTDTLHVQDEEAFDPSDIHLEEFPERRVHDMERLKRYVQQEFFCADPVRYEKVLRQIRTSKPTERARSYVDQMYRNESNQLICQMCKKAVSYRVIREITNLGIELPQLHLCLCSECDRRYQQVRDSNREKFRADVERVLVNIDLQRTEEAYAANLTDDCTVYFTQSHLAEIQEILHLLHDCASLDESTEES